MDISIIFKIAAVGIIIAVVNQVLKHSGKDEIATFTTLAGVIVVLLMMLNMITDLFGKVSMLFNLF